MCLVSCPPVRQGSHRCKPRSPTGSGRWPYDVSDNLRVVAETNQPPETTQSLLSGRVELPTSDGGYRFNLFESESGGLLVSFHVRDATVNDGEIRHVSAEAIGDGIGTQMEAAGWERFISAQR